MASRSRSGAVEGATGQALVGFAALAFLYFAGEVLKPLALSVLLSFALMPVATRLERRGLPRALSVALTVLIVLGGLSGVGLVVARQLTTLAERLPDYEDNIESKLGVITRSDGTSATDRLSTMVDHVTAKLESPRPEDPNAPAPIPKVRVIQETSFQERLRAWAGPYLEALGVFSFVLVLVLFIMTGREDLRDRIVSLFGHRHVGLTTRTMEEIGGRISRYLVTVALLNSGFGLVIGTGLAIIGVPFALLWGSLAALLRFIPYVGAAVTFALPTAFAAAHFPGWGQVIAVVILFGVVETILNSFLEPMIFGKTTGVSALGLLIAAMFWTWLWGAMGLLLSTPMTVCLAVIGKYVPGLRFFSTLLGEDSELEPHLRYFQRIMALDRDGAAAVVRAEAESRPVIEVFDRVLIPALARAGRDAGRGRLDESEQNFLWEVTGEVIDELVARAAIDPEEAGFAPPRPADAPPGRVVGLASDQSDALVLRMVGACLTPSGVTLEIPTPGSSPLDVHESLAESTASVVLISHLPPESIASARYFIRRLRAQNPGLPILVGLWGAGRQGVSSAIRRLGESGTWIPAASAAEARDRILRLVDPAEVDQPDAAPLPT